MRERGELEQFFFHYEPIMLLFSVHPFGFNRAPHSLRLMPSTYAKQHRKNAYIVGYKMKLGYGKTREMKSKSNKNKQQKKRGKKQNAVPFDNTKHIKNYEKKNTNIKN